MASKPEVRNLVFFCDGTWNSPEEEQFGQPTATNVHRLYRACADEASSGGRQLTWYQPGVGSGGSVLKRVWEGSTGSGIGANIRRVYSAIAAQYQGPQDRIFLIGFSRGAFTARSVAGMIEQVGLLREPTRDAVEAAYALYCRCKDADEVAARRGLNTPELHPDVRIHAIGVWDTVGALGLALWGWSFNLRAIWSNSFHHLSPNRSVDHVFHALAIDEKRTSFMPVPWRELPAGLAGPRPQVEETWFRGVHSDVGGGYADCGLSDIALQWMAQRLAAQGLLLRPAMPPARPDPWARVHNSARGPLWTNVATWPRWPALRTLEEGASARCAMHPSVAQREQGLAARGLDETVRRRLAVGESMSVSVRARNQWEYTGLVLVPGARYQVRARGLWQDWQDTPVGPGGQDAADESWLKRCVRWMKREPTAPWMSLMGVPVAERGWRWKELGLLQALRYLLLEDPPEFRRQQVVIGPGTELQGLADEESLLWCWANDAWRFYGNNTGSVTLEIRRSA